MRTPLFPELDARGWFGGEISASGWFDDGLISDASTPSRRSSPGYAVTVTPDPVTTRLASVTIAGPNTSVLAKLAETAQNSTVTVPIPGGTSTRSSRDPADTGKSSSFYIQ